MDPMIAFVFGASAFFFGWMVGNLIGRRQGWAACETNRRLLIAAGRVNPWTGKPT
jgi:hypothetical protein